MRKKQKKKSICDFEAYKDYRENNRAIATRDNVENFIDYGKVVSKFFEKIGEYVVTSSDGVVIDGLGYFGVVNTNMKVTQLDRRQKVFEDEFNWETKGYCFSLFFVPENRLPKLIKSYTLDYTFARHVKQKLSLSLKSGNKYNFKPSIINEKKRIKSRNPNSNPKV